MLTAKGRRLADRGWPAVIAAITRLSRTSRPTAEHLSSVEELWSALKLAVTGSGKPLRSVSTA